MALGSPVDAQTATPLPTLTTQPATPTATVTSTPTTIPTSQTTITPTVLTTITITPTTALTPVPTNGNVLLLPTATSFPARVLAETGIAPSQTMGVGLLILGVVFVISRANNKSNKNQA